MSAVTEPLAHSWCDLESTHLDDTAWLQALKWRSSACESVTKTAKAGEVINFGKALTASLKSNRKIGKKHVAKSLARLQLLWQSEETSENAELPTMSGCLFDDVSQLPAVLFQNMEDIPTEQTLVAALWVLNLRAAELDPETIVSLWRWTLQESQRFLQQTHELDPEDGFDNLSSLELHTLAAITFQDLKGGNKLLKTVNKQLQQSFAESIDGDGTPHAEWISDIEGTLCTLSRINLFGELSSSTAWDIKSTKLLKHFFDRVATLVTGATHRAFADSQKYLTFQKFEVIAELLGNDAESGLAKLFQGREKKAKPINTWLLPEECHQSDWAEWGCLRSKWSSPVDQCAIKHDEDIPSIDVVTADIPLFSGQWELRLEADGQPITWTDNWVCVCWFSDEEASFIELHQEQQGIKVLRQLTLMREENMLLVADAISSETAQKLTYEMSLPVANGWDFEADSSTREAALQHEKTRVRVFPISCPQQRVHSSDGAIAMQGPHLTVKHRTDSSGMFVATMFDWSKKRTKKPVDWSRLTVAEDTKAIPASIANGYRLRIGKSQWMLYHSLHQPDFPRSVLGYHTNEETVFARVEANGEIVPIVEVTPED